MTPHLSLRHHTIAPHSRRVPSRLYDFEIKRSFNSSTSALVYRGHSRTEVPSRCRGVKLSISPYGIDAPRPQVECMSGPNHAVCRRYTHVAMYTTSVGPRGPAYQPQSLHCRRYKPDNLSSTSPSRVPLAAIFPHIPTIDRKLPSWIPTSTVTPRFLRDWLDSSRLDTFQLLARRGLKIH